MSRQQVNLYQDELRPKKLNYSAAMMAQLSLVLIVVLSVVTGFIYFQLQLQQKQYVLSQQIQKQATADLQKLQTELSLRKKDAVLAKRVVDKTKELSNKKKVLNILSRDEFGNTKGFVEHVSGLARQRINGLWLTQIRIASGGTNVSLQGTTNKPALLPKYLQRLSAEKAFAGTEFESLLMARQEKKKQWLNFSLQNKKTEEAVQ